MAAKNTKRNARATPTARSAGKSGRAVSGRKAVVRSTAARKRKPPAARRGGSAPKPAATRKAAPKRMASRKTAPKRLATRKPAAKQAQRIVAAPPADLRWTDTLADGTHVIVRPIAPKDAQAEREFIERLSPESRRLRFLGQISAPSDDMVRRFVEIDYDQDMAFIALVHRDNKTQEIGVSRYSRGANGSSCECAVTVSDEWRHRGLATLLMRHLIEFARSHGIRTMVSYDAVENTEMRTLADSLGFARRNDPDDPHMVIHRLEL